LSSLELLISDDSLEESESLSESDSDSDELSDSEEEYLLFFFLLFEDFLRRLLCFSSLASTSDEILDNFDLTFFLSVG
jgi:hypothetical protein